MTSAVIEDCVDVGTEKESLIQEPGPGKAGCAPVGHSRWER